VFLTANDLKRSDTTRLLTKSLVKIKSLQFWPRARRCKAIMSALKSIARGQKPSCNALCNLQRVGCGGVDLFSFGRSASYTSCIRASILPLRVYRHEINGCSPALYATCDNARYSSSTARDLLSTPGLPQLGSRPPRAYRCRRRARLRRRAGGLLHRRRCALGRRIPGAEGQSVFPANRPPAGRHAARARILLLHRGARAIIACVLSLALSP
jgi:hypothetical protein